MLWTPLYCKCYSDDEFSLVLPFISLSQDLVSINSAKTAELVAVHFADEVQSIVTSLQVCNIAECQRFLCRLHGSVGRLHYPVRTHDVEMNPKLFSDCIYLQLQYSALLHVHTQTDCTAKKSVSKGSCHCCIVCLIPLCCVCVNVYVHCLSFYSLILR